MKKSKKFKRVKFNPEIISNAFEKMHSLIDGEENTEPESMKIDTSDESWVFDNLSEFYAEYRKNFERASIEYYFYCEDREKYLSADNSAFLNVFNLAVYNYGSFYTLVEIKMPERFQIEEVFSIFENAVESCQIPEDELPPPTIPKIFIGHGRDSQWRDLKDHLTDQHGLKIIAYETGPRAGKSVKEVLKELTKKSSFALLVLTGEDIHQDGKPHARENVIHEVGLFQGNLGFEKAIILLEEGVEEFSNVLGINQIRFSKGNIKETFGDVVATINREFGPAD